MITTVETMQQINTEAHDVEKLLTRAQAIKATNKDYMINFKDLEVSSDCTLFFANEWFDVTDYALSQICSKLKVPVDYAKRCFNSHGSKLGALNLMHWLEGDKRKVLMRTFGDTVRGVLSDRYSIMDSTDILSWLNKFQGIENYELRGSYLSEDRLHVRLISSQKLPIVGEDLHAGFLIDNSDVGKSSVNMRMVIYSAMYGNYVYLPKQMSMLFNQKHVGITQDQFEQQVADNILKVPELSTQAVECIEKTRKQRFNPLQFEKALEKVKHDTRIGDDRLDQIRELVATRYGYDRWGLINAATDLARSFTLDKRNELERYAATLFV